MCVCVHARARVCVYVNAIPILQNDVCMPMIEILASCNYRTVGKNVTSIDILLDVGETFSCVRNIFQKYIAKYDFSV